MIFPPEVIKSTLYRRYCSSVIDIEDYFKKRSVDCICISETEQKRQACSFIAVNNNTLIHFDETFDDQTCSLLQQKKIEYIPVHATHLKNKNRALSSYVLPVHRS
jgi:arginine deiminase